MASIKLFISVFARAVIFFYISTFALLAGYLLSDFFIVSNTPIKLAISNEGSILKPNDDLDYIVEFYRNKQHCVDDVQRYISRIEHGKREVFLRDRFVGVLEEGFHSLTETIKASEHEPFKPGKYILRLFVISRCSLLTRVVKHEDAPFEVVSNE